MTKLLHTTRIEAGLLNKLCCYQPHKAELKAQKLHVNHNTQVSSHTLESSCSKIRPYIDIYQKSYKMV